MNTPRPNFDLLGYVDSLTENSTLDEINTALFYDLKKESIGYYDQVISDESLKRRVLEQIAQYQYFDADESYSETSMYMTAYPIVLWLKNEITKKIAGDELNNQNGERSPIFDCGSCELINEIKNRLGAAANISVYGNPVTPFWNTYIEMLSLDKNTSVRTPISNTLETLKALHDDIYSNISRSEEMYELKELANITDSIGNYFQAANEKPDAFIPKGNGTENERLYNESALIEMRGIRVLMLLNNKLQANPRLKKRLAFLDKSRRKKYRDPGRLYSVFIQRPALNPFRNIKDTFIYTLETLADFKKFPINNLRFLMIVAAKIIALILFVVSIVAFIVNNGLAEQFALVTSRQISAAFTTGAISVYFHPYAFPAILILLGAALILSYGLYIKYASIPKKIIMISILVLQLFLVLFFIPLLLLLLFMTIQDQVFIDNIHLLERLSPVMQFFFTHLEAYMGLVQNGAVIAVVATLFFALPIVAFILMGKHRDPMRTDDRSRANVFMHWFVTSIEIFVLLPLLLLLVKNILPLFVVILIGAAIIIGIKLIIFFAGSGGGEGSSSAGGESSGGAAFSSSSSLPNYTPPADSKFQVTVKLSYVGHKHPYEGTYTVNAVDKSAAKKKASDLLRNDLIQSKQISSFGEMCKWDSYPDIKKL